jgi:hypothetical protein
MHLRAARARQILEVVPDHTITRPVTRWAYEIIRAVVDAGRDLDPVVVLAAARRYPGSQALDPGQPPRPLRYHRFAVYLADAYTQTCNPPAAHSYAHDVLEQAYRRVLRAHGIRMAHLADSNADLAYLAGQFSAAAADLDDLRRHAEAAAPD